MPLTITRQSPAAPWRSLAIRIGLVFGLIGIAVIGHWIDRDGLIDHHDGHISFGDVIYFTMITVATVGYGDIAPISDSARMFDAFVVTPIRLFVWLIFIGSAYDFLLRGVWEKWKMRRLQSDLHNHIIVAGHGESGSEAVAELLRRGSTPESIVVIEPNTVARDAAAALGLTVMDADATRNTTLEAVCLPRARALIVAAGRDDTSILITLTAHGLAPNVPIRTVIKNRDNEQLARTAGADTVINPASFAGLLLAGACHGSHIADYMADLAAVDGRVKLAQRPVRPDEIGQPLSSLKTGLGVRIYRAGQPIGFWEDGAQALRPGDELVEIIPSP
ncbi:potassium channel family protein [Polymorphobacter sp.]|uniref:potassium channel family protein n=1 Tax=Polymorphobacter sp. TaxID=1909290 RepID=UPI003F6E67DB